MSDLNSWEDDPAAQDDNLSRQTQQSLHLNHSQQQPGAAPGGSFRPNVNAFQPGAQTFQPGQQYQQYGGGQYGGYQQQQAHGSGYPQYGGQADYGQYGQVYGYVYGQAAQAAHNVQQAGGYAQQQQSQSFQPQAQAQAQAPSFQPRQAPVLAKRPEVGEPIFQSSQPSQAPPVLPKPVVKSEGGAKVLSIGGDGPAPKAKVMSIGAVTKSLPAEGKETRKETTAAGDGSKAAAAKAIEKTEKNNDKLRSSSGAGSAPSSGRSSPTAAAGEAKTAAREVDAVAKDQAADVDEETLEEIYGKEHVNLIFIGHVDAGKSTLGGSILYATGMVDERTMDKYKREAKDAGRETWYLSWALDLTKEERAKGKTVEVGRGFFETEKRRYTILDAPGHKTFVPNMIGGASQADVGILVISARKGEYETGFEKGGQTREHAMLAKTQGVNKLIVAVNKMDDPTVEWSKERFDECTSKLRVFLKGTGYDPKTGTSRYISLSSTRSPCRILTYVRPLLHAHVRPDHGGNQEPRAKGRRSLVRWTLASRISRRHEDVGAKGQRPVHDAH
jgi:peptide chain release factor subunit 3